MPAICWAGKLLGWQNASKPLSHSCTQSVFTTFLPTNKALPAFRWPGTMPAECWPSKMPAFRWAGKVLGWQNASKPLSSTTTPLVFSIGPPPATPATFSLGWQNASRLPAPPRRPYPHNRRPLDYLAILFCAKLISHQHLTITLEISST